MFALSVIRADTVLTPCLKPLRNLMNVRMVSIESELFVIGVCSNTSDCGSFDDFFFLDAIIPDSSVFDFSNVFQHRLAQFFIVTKADA
jgi:hypothetical protein